MLKITDIDFERVKKLKTLFENEVDRVKHELEFKFEQIKTKVNLNLIENALHFALAQDYGEALLAKFYVTHPLRVTCFIVDWMVYYQDFSTDFVIASLLHNAIEKDILTAEELKHRYGEWIAKTIQTLTQDRVALKNPILKNKYYENIYALDKYGQLLKLYDKFDNLYAISLNPSAEIRTEYILEIETKVRPIAEKFSPEILNYLDALICRMKEVGYFNPY
jgi:(p)ppGpp synthase/HD superfamily hydrolase